jgi:hypothetical protein
MGNNPNPNNKKFWEKLKRFLKTLTKEFFIGAFITFLVGLILRYYINDIFNIDVFKEYVNIVSICYYSFMALFSKFSKDFLAECFVVFIEENVLYMNESGANQVGGNPNPVGNNPGEGNPNPVGNNPGVGNPNPVGNNPGGGNPNLVGNNPGGGNPQQLRANKTNGPIQVNDPNNQNFQYNPNGTNQPILSNVA